MAKSNFLGGLSPSTSELGGLKPSLFPSHCIAYQVNYQKFTTIVSVYCWIRHSIFFLIGTYTHAHFTHGHQHYLLWRSMYEIQIILLCVYLCVEQILQFKKRGSCDHALSPPTTFTQNLQKHSCDFVHLVQARQERVLRNIVGLITIIYIEWPKM